jgi:hypothetical protein
MVEPVQPVGATAIQAAVALLLRLCAPPLLPIVMLAVRAPYRAVSLRLDLGEGLGLPTEIAHPVRGMLKLRGRQAIEAAKNWRNSWGFIGMSTTAWKAHIG